MIEDRILVWRFNRGDPAALCRIYEKYRDGLLKVAAALLHDRSGVEDVLHDVFVDFAQATGRFQLRDSLKGYLSICVANRARDLNRTRRRRSTASLDEIDTLPADGDSPEHAVMSRDLVARLDAAMAELPEEQREIVVLHLQGKLPVTLKQWQNMDRSGPPAFEAFQLTYCESLPDSVFDVHIPSDVKYVEKPLQIPEETVGVLGNPQDGISANGLTQQEAADKALRTLYQAVIDQDLDRLKSICPLCRNWGDDFLRTAIFKPDKGDRIVEILEIGPIRRMGHSPLGPIAAVPTTVKLKNGRKAEQQMVVQFRQFGDESSCVVHGPYGLPREVE